jgi:hypothetical protein
LPDSREESSQLTIGYIQRKYAAIYEQGFFDGYAACKNYAEMQRLSWNGDPLYKRIVTARKMIELQNMSTQKSLTLLGGAYDKIEDFRQNSLVIVLIDAQSKLIK